MIGRQAHHQEDNCFSVELSETDAKNHYFANNALRIG